MTYSTINKTKFGNCITCGAKDTKVVKVKKDTYCINCHNRNKALEQLEKQKKRNALRVDTTKVRKLGKMQDVSLEQKALNASKAAAMQRWFAERREEMKGKCANCGGKTMKYNGDKFYYSIAHILPKAYFKSVATHPLNWIELCFYGNSCHTNYDNHMIDIMELNCFDEVISKFVKMYPDIDKDERRRIPQILLNYVEAEK